MYSDSSRCVLGLILTRGQNTLRITEGVGWLLLLVIIVVIIVVIDDNGGGDASVDVIAILILMLCGREEEAGEKTGGGAGGGRPRQPGRRVQHSIAVCIAPFRQSDSGGVNDDDREQGRRERQCTLYGNGDGG